MREIVIKKVWERKFLKWNKVSKIGVEGAPLHDILVSQSDNKLACFRDDDSEKYYLYSLVTGGLIITSMYMIDCISDNYFIIKADKVSDYKLYCVNHEDNTYTLVRENYCEYDYYNNILVEYTPMNKQVTITDMESTEKWEFVVSELPDSKYNNMVIYYEFFSYGKFVISLEFQDKGAYFNCFNIKTNKFTFNQFIYGGVGDTGEYDGKIYIITHDDKLIDEKGNVVIECECSYIKFVQDLPYVIIDNNDLWGLARVENGEILIPVKYDYFTFYALEGCVVVEKGGKYGLVDLENGKTIFETKYDEIIVLDNVYRAITKTYETYVKDKK